MIGKKVRLALAVAAVSTGAAVTPVAMTATPAQAAQCVNLAGGVHTSGIYKYASAKNICSGTYRFRFLFGHDPVIGSPCFTIQGYKTGSFKYASRFDPNPHAIQYC